MSFFIKSIRFKFLHVINETMCILSPVLVEFVAALLLGNLF